MKINESKLKTILEKRLNRQATSAELSNAATDTNLILEVLVEEIEAIKKKVGI